MKCLLFEFYKMNKKIIFLSWIVLFSSTLLSQEIARFTVDAGDFDRLDCPVSIDLDKLNYNIDSNRDSIALILYEVSKSGWKRVECQQEHGICNRLWFILNGHTSKHTIRTFVLQTGEKTKTDKLMTVRKTSNKLVLRNGTRNILAYRYQTMMPPPGVDSLYAKSGFIHPLWSPQGVILTRIQPPDHRHHYGIWGPWTKTHIGGREVDFWNLGKGQGTVRFSGFLSLEEGAVFCGFTSHQEHIDLGGKPGNQTALNEVLQVRSWNLHKNTWMIDYFTIQNCPLDSGIFLDAYRYGGGIGFRATEKWTKENSTVLTSEGKNRKTADGTKARWCRVEGASGMGRSGILFMDSPANMDFPEPIRVWPENANNGRGDMFFEFCPIRLKSREFEKGRNYMLKYRLIVFDGELSSTEAEIYWQEFAYPPKIVIEK